LRQNFEPSTGSTSGIRRWTTEALHPPFFIFSGFDNLLSKIKTQNALA
jgi:hypothetical protein